jgi:hypothetical protein
VQTVPRHGLPTPPRFSRSTKTFFDELSRSISQAYAGSVGVRDPLTRTRAPRESARERERESARLNQGRSAR